MSHIHPIGAFGGNLNAAAEYQERLARQGADQKAARRAKNGEKSEVRTFDSAVDTDEESAPDREEGSDSEGGGGGDTGGGNSGDGSDSDSPWHAKA